MKSNTDLLDTCHEKYKSFLTECSSESGQRSKLNECKKAETIPTEGAKLGLSGTFDFKIRAQVSSANCYFGMSHCYRIGPRDQKKSPSGLEIFQSCLKKFNDLASQVGDSNPGQKDDLTRAISFTAAVDRISNIQYKCWKQKGDQQESEARDLVKTSAAARDGSTQGAIDCIDKDNGNRVCQYQRDGSHLQELDPNHIDPKDLKGSNPVNFKDCSGELLGDGETVTTAGHCTADASGEQTLTVYDKNGNPQTLTANCNKGVDEGYNKTDFSVCKLNSKVEANPVYLATYDSSVGEGCKTSGYVMKCGSQFYQNLTSQPIEAISFPRRFNSETITSTESPVYTRGTAFYDSSNNQIYVDGLVCTGGCSGSGWLVNYEGRQVVVASHNYGDRYDPNLSHSSIVPNRVLDGLMVQSVSTEKLGAGTILFSGLPM